jgi:AcrR family transcriptional regulator
MNDETPNARRGRPANAAARQARTDHILAAARRCFARGGFHGAGTADICREAGISPANLYQYFASKDDLILAIVAGYRSDDMEFLALLAAADSLDAALEQHLAALETELSDDDALYPRLRLEILSEATRNDRVRTAVRVAEQQVQACLCALIAQAQAKGEVSDRLDADTMASLCLSLYDGAFVRDTALCIAPPWQGLALMIRRLLSPS